MAARPSSTKCVPNGWLYMCISASPRSSSVPMQAWRPPSLREIAPLAPAWHRVGNLIFRYGEHFYNFEGLRRYKAKFDPTWEPRYLVARGGIALPRVLVDVSLLIAGGVKELFTR